MLLPKEKHGDITKIRLNGCSVGKNTEAAYNLESHVAIVFQGYKNHIAEPAVVILEITTHIYIQGDTFIYHYYSINLQILVEQLSFAYY